MAKKKVKTGSARLEELFGQLSFADLIHSERVCQEKTLKEFADELGISVQSLSDLEKGRRIPSSARARDMAQTLGFSEKVWIATALQDKLRAANIPYKVSIA